MKRFKASLQLPVYHHGSNLPTDCILEFTKSQVFIPDTFNCHYANYTIRNGDYYTLMPPKDNEDIMQRYEVKIGNNPLVRLSITKANEAKLKKIHRLGWFYKSENTWIKQAILAAIISILTYLISQHFGFKSGYQDGLKKAQEEYRKSIPPR